jgi:hypothetical protein
MQLGQRRPPEPKRPVLQQWPPEQQEPKLLEPRPRGWTLPGHRPRSTDPRN